MTTNIVFAFEAFPDMSIESNILADPDIKFLWSHGVDTPESRAVMAEADVLVIALQKVTADVLDAMPRCRLISRLGVGIDNIDVASATARGIWVANVPDYGVDEVATHAIALVLAQLRGLHTLIGPTKAGAYDGQAVRPIRRLTTQTLGVMGYGRIGRAAGSKGAGLGMRVIAYDPFLSDDQIRATGAEPVSMETLLRESDFITLHLPLDAKTRHTINAQTLSQMKSSAYLVNTARGGLIDEAALLDAIRAGKIRGAALDVLSAEPPPADDPVLQGLLKEPGVLITPHVAWYSEEAQVDMRTRAAEDIARVLGGNRPRTPVNNIPSKAPNS
jgi:D-3-phosphoglycerate dehydrogenase / 2-oxoglutarate reductase